MVCPICQSRLVKTGITFWETSSNPEISPSLHSTYSCSNPCCGSNMGDFTWTLVGDTYIMHHLQTHQEEEV